MLASFLIVLFVALSSVAILTPPTKKSWAFQALPLAASAALSAAFKLFIELTVKSFTKVTVPLFPPTSKYAFKSAASWLVPGIAVVGPFPHA